MAVYLFSLKLFSGFGHTFLWPPAPDPWATGYSGPGNSATTRHRPGNRQSHASFMLRGKQTQKIMKDIAERATLNRDARLKF